MIYFIKALNSGLIKIGYTKNVGERVASLRSNSPEELHILKITEGDIEDEKRIHNKFKHFNERNEWFRPEKSLLDFIESSKEISYVERPRRMSRSKRKVIYFIQSNSNMINIGRAVDIRRIIYFIRKGSSDPDEKFTLIGEAEGSEADLLGIREIFKDLHSHRDWYRSNDSLIQFIKHFCSKK